ncbi:ribonuclease P protein component [Rothia sp. CCM 9419]|uniref:ribonuclease P protein component n=1 Tax=Rothia sp. CCM 9419 TaxID=3402662 RepID=UPI003ADCBC7D
MLAQQHRMRTKVQFAETTRSGVRSGRRNLVLYATSHGESPTIIGFIVSKTVGNAVTRNLVKRRLRALSALTLKKNPQGHQIVIRALPASSHATWEELSQDYENALTSTLAKMASQQNLQAVAQSPETAPLSCERNAENPS